MDNGNTGNNQADSINELQDLKAQAISVLLPLVDNLQEPPERKFEILMMAARSSEDAGLLRKTLEVAQQLEGDQKAGAVLDVLNEIDLKLRSQS